MNNLIKLLKVEGKEINHFFEKASLEGEGTPQEVSDRRESALTNILRKYFPFPYRVAKGNIRDSYGKSSMSIDCILLNPCHPYTTTDEVKYSIILADGVDVAIELKPSLDSESEIQRSLNQLKSVKELKRKKSGLLNFRNKYTKEFQETCKTIPSVLFSTKIYANERLLFEKIVSYYENEKIKRECQLDMLVVNEKFIVINNRKDHYFYNDKIEEGLVIFDFNELTLAAFLLYLNKLPQSEMRLSSSVLEHYLEIRPEYVKTYKDLNERLLNI
jgi:hypothetical protein